jgi:hypothetical protein
MGGVAKEYITKLGCEIYFHYDHIVSTTGDALKIANLGTSVWDLKSRKTLLYLKPSPVSKFLGHVEFSFPLFRFLFWQFSIFYIILKETGDPTTTIITTTTPGRLLLVAAAHVSRDTRRELRASRDTYTVFAMCIRFQRCNLRLPICQLPKCSSFNRHSLPVGE